MMKMYFRLVFVMLSIFCVLTLGAQSLVEEIGTMADIVVDMNGSGDYTTVQEAIGSIPDNNDAWKIILVKNGTYYEKVVLGYKKTKVILVGEDVDSTIITFDDYGNKVLPGHTFSTYTFRADANDFQAYNITFECTAGGRGQGVAYHSNGDRQILYHCRLLGDQDTYFDNFRTRRYIKDCLITGGTDYIFGFGVTLFDSCQIHSIAGGYITAASTPQHYEFGYVFKDCRLTTKNGAVGVSLGRPWFDWSNTVFYECWEPAGIISTGWSAWSGREATCFYREYNCYGPGSDTLNRVSYGKQLDQAKADRYNIDTIFAKSNFPTHLGYDGDTAELMHMYRRFEASGYPERADTILYAGRDAYPTYPTENWSPEFHEGVYTIIKDYTLAFMDSLNGIISVEKILWNDNEISDFIPENLKYAIELDDTVSIVPTLYVVGEGVKASVEYPETLPGEASIEVLSKDEVSGYNYDVYFSKDSAYWDAGLGQVIINRRDTLVIIPNQDEYTVVLPLGETRVSSLIVKTKLPGQRYQKSGYPDSYPGSMTITITAPDGETEKIYTLNIELTPNLVKTETGKSGISVINPANENLQIVYFGNEIMDATINIYDINGRSVLSKELHNIGSGITDTNLSLTNLRTGLYLYSILTKEENYSGKFLRSE